jgi:hypothetical protein
MSRSPKIPLSLGLAAAAVVLILPAVARASTNVVPNPGFEQGGCGGNTPVICGWESYAISQDTTNPHSGNSSMHLDCGASGCYADPYSGWASVEASTDSSFCAAIGPSVHPASFWYRDVVGDTVSLDASFYSGTDCTGSVGWDSLSGPPSGSGWQQLSGGLAAPAGTQSVLFGLSVSAYCGDYCSLAANFDDVNVDDTTTTTPIIASFSPTSGWFGMSISISGDNFTGGTSVTFNGTEAQFSIQSDQSISANVPPGATTGPISVTTANGTGVSSSSFTLVPPPTISSFTPTSGPIGTTVDIHGSNFTGAVSVDFNGFPAADFTIDTDSEIHATVSTSGTTGPISVTTGSGTGYSASPFTVPIPTISSITPTSGRVGTTVDIHGSDFTAVTWMDFNNDPDRQYTIDSDTEIHATVPCGAWPGPIVLGTADGNGHISSATFTVTAQAPSISSFTPTSGPVGTTVDIHGSNLCGAIPKFNGTQANSWTLGLSDSEVQAWVPDGATTGPISVTTPGGTATSSGSFTFIPPPSISSFTPGSGPVGTTVMITGTNLTGATSVKFNGSAASFTVNSATSITATVPSGATTGAIWVTTPGGTATTAGYLFVVTVPPPPTISSFSPTSGPAGASVDIQGTNLTGATSVKFNGTADPSFVVNSPTDITAHVPAGATTGPISVTTPGGTGTSTTSFPVTVPPTISSFAPTSGPVRTSVSITGSNFTGASSVTFNGAAASYTVNSPTSITATVPAATTTGPIAVTTAGGTVTSSSSYTMILPPKITSFSPTSGHTGQQVRLTGSNLSGATSVKLGTTAAKFTVGSSTSITATVPTIAPGSYKWSVTTPAGTATCTGSFHVT